jgi:hypothetical protein
VVAEEWTPLPDEVPCPACGVTGKLSLRTVFRAQPIGSYSLAGAQMKFSARREREFKCAACGATGSVVPTD